MRHRSAILAPAAFALASCGSGVEPGHSGSAARAELLCLAEEGNSQLKNEAETGASLARLTDQDARRMLARVARESAGAWAEATAFPPVRARHREAPPRVRLSPRAPGLGWRIAAPFPRGVTLVVEATAGPDRSGVVRMLHVDRTAGSRLVDMDFPKLVNYLLGMAATERDRERPLGGASRSAESMLLVIADDAARWREVRDLLSVAIAGREFVKTFDRVSFARAAGMPSPLGDLARPLAIHDALRLAGDDAEILEDDVAVRVTDGMSLDGIRGAVAAQTGRIVLGADPDVPMEFFQLVLDEVLAGRSLRATGRRCDVELVAH